MTDKPNSNPEYWGVRGIGTGYGNGKCWVTGEPMHMGKDVSGFVTSREAGERVVKILGNAQLDFRPSEPNWIQVKIAVSEGKEAALTRLYNAVNACDGILTERMVIWARDPEGSPGYMPTAVKLFDQINAAENAAPTP